MNRTLCCLLTMALLSSVLLADSSSTPPLPPLSPAAKGALDAYQKKMYKSIGSRWYLSVEQNQTLLQLGEVRVKFFVRANGVIDQISVSGSSGRTDVLETISTKAVERASGIMEPFSGAMKQELGDGYWDSITFTITKDGPATITSSQDPPVPLAQENAVPITGAFGMNLGDVFNDDVLATKTDQGYTFMPTNAYDDLSVYTVSICPKSKQIFRILATSAPFKTAKEAQERADVLMKLLNEKYQGKLHNGSRSIQVSVETNPMPILTLRYVDAKLAEQAFKEHAEMDAAKVADDAKHVNPAGL